MLNSGLETSINYKELMSLKVLKGLGREKEILQNDVYLTERKVSHRHNCPGSDVTRKQKAAGLEELPPLEGLAGRDHSENSAGRG